MTPKPEIINGNLAVKKENPLLKWLVKVIAAIHTWWIELKWVKRWLHKHRGKVQVRRQNRQRRQAARLAKKAIIFIDGIDLWMAKHKFSRQQRRDFWRKFVKSSMLRETLAQDILSKNIKRGK